MVVILASNLGRLQVTLSWEIHFNITNKQLGTLVHFLKVTRINISMVWEYLFWKPQRCGISTFLLFF